MSDYQDFDEKSVAAPTPTPPPRKQPSTERQQPVADNKSINVKDLPNDGSVSSYVKSETVATMQQALINLARDISSHNIQDTPERSIGEHDVLTGADPFMNFLVDSYMNKAKTQGQQVVDVDAKQPTRMDTAKTNDNFKGVLRTIMRVGSATAEQRPDGIWGPRTNNALKQIYALAYALIQVQKDMGMEISYYTDADLSELYNSIPQDPNIPTSQKNALATTITKNLDKFRAVYDNFREKILNNPGYHAAIAQQKPLMVSKATAPTLSGREQELYEKNKSVEVDINLNGHKVSIMPYNVLNMDNFKKYLQSKASIIGFTPEELNSVITDNNKTLEYLQQVAGQLKE